MRVRLRNDGRLARAKNKLRREVTLALKPRDQQRVIVSLTSYPQRIDYVADVVRSLFAQLQLPDLTVLYLSEDQFPDGVKSLPPSLTSCLGRDFQIRWVRGDMRSHKKYLYAVRDFPEDLVITVDDDIVCRNTLVGDLLDAHARHPHAVAAIRTHLMEFDANGVLLPYSSWQMEVGNPRPELCDRPSMRLFGTSGAGMLLPPGSLPAAAFDTGTIGETCPNADDVWLKAMTAIAGWPTVSVAGWQGVDCIEGSQETSLWATNQRGGNDDAIRKVRAYCEKDLGVECFDSLFHDDALLD